VRLLLAALALCLVAGCSSSEPTDPVVAPDSWLGMAPGDARAFHGPGGKLILIAVDETYDIDGEYASATTWSIGSSYTTDYWVQDADGTLWWYGRKGSWRAGRHGEQPREVSLDNGTATFGDRTITLGDAGPTRLETPEGTYEPAGS
jgi:hypothetical protein